jgi:cytochrome c-type biogenesis protein CcmF
MVDIGSLALAIAWVLALYAALMSLAGAYWRKRDFIASAEHASLAVWGLVTIAGAALLHALVTHDFNLEYVAHYSSSTLPLPYTIAALWGGQSGSLLFWLMILTSMGAVVCCRTASATAS